MHLTVFRSDPYSGCEGRSVSDEPSVRLVIGRSGLSGNLTCQAVLGTKTDSCTAVHDTLHQIGHKICRILAYRLLGPVAEFTKDISHTVFYAGHEHR